MKQKIKLVEIFPDGSSNTSIFDVCSETFDYVSYLVRTGKRSQVNIVMI